MYVLTIALSKYTFILTLKLIIIRENVDSKQAKTSIDWPTISATIPSL